WFMGFRRALDDIARQVIASRGASLPWPIMNVPGDIISMFDKSRCHQMLVARGVPEVPEWLRWVTSYEHLRAAMAERHWRRVFIKLRYGSSSSGVLAYETNGRQEQAWTSVELAVVNGETRLYNSLKVR